MKSLIFASCIALASCGGSSSESSNDTAADTNTDTTTDTTTGGTSTPGENANPVAATTYDFPNYQTEKAKVLLGEEFNLYVWGSNIADYPASSYVKISFAEEGDNVVLKTNTGLSMPQHPFTPVVKANGYYQFSFNAFQDGTTASFVLKLPYEPGWVSAYYAPKGGVMGAIPVVELTQERIGSADYYGKDAPQLLADISGTYQTDEQINTIGITAYISHAIKAVVRADSITYVVKPDCQVITQEWDGNGDSIVGKRIELQNQSNAHDYMDQRIGFEIEDGKVTGIWNGSGTWRGSLRSSPNLEDIQPSDIGCE